MQESIPKKSLKIPLSAIKTLQTTIENSFNIHKEDYDQAFITYISKEVKKLKKWSKKFLRLLAQNKPKNSIQSKKEKVSTVLRNFELRKLSSKRLKKLNSPLITRTKSINQIIKKTSIQTTFTKTPKRLFSKQKKIEPNITQNTEEEKLLTKNIEKLEKRTKQLERSIEFEKGKLINLIYHNLQTQAKMNLPTPKLKTNNKNYPKLKPPIISTTVIINYSPPHTPQSDIELNWPSASSMNTPSLPASQILKTLPKILYSSPKFEKPLEFLNLPDLHGPFYTANGKDTVISQYFNNRRNGIGLYIWEDGRVYEGGWKDGKCEGYGRMVFKNGNWYQGEMRGDRKHGVGVFHWKEGDWYEGEYQDDVICGFGVYFWKSGDWFEGEWKEGVFWGKGKKGGKDGVEKEGYWENGKFVKDL